MIEIIPPRDRRRGPARAVTVLAVLAAVLAGCGGSDDGDEGEGAADVSAPDDAPADAPTTVPEDASGTTAASDTATTAPADTAAGDDTATTTGADGTDAGRCPISVELASEVLGTPMELAPGACQFFPPERASPTLLFVRLGSGVCAEGMPAALGYDQQVEGFEVAAWTRSTVMFGTGLLLCTPNAFEVSVDLVEDTGGQERAIVEQLARVVLDAGG